LPARQALNGDDTTLGRCVASRYCGDCAASSEADSILSSTAAIIARPVQRLSESGPPQKPPTTPAAAWLEPRCVNSHPGPRPSRLLVASGPPFQSSSFVFRPAGSTRADLRIEQPPGRRPCGGHPVSGDSNIPARSSWEGACDKDESTPPHPARLRASPSGGASLARGNGWVKAWRTGRRIQTLMDQSRLHLHLQAKQRLIGMLDGFVPRIPTPTANRRRTGCLVTAEVRRSTSVTEPCAREPIKKHSPKLFFREGRRASDRACPHTPNGLTPARDRCVWSRRERRRPRRCARWRVDLPRGNSVVVEP